MNSPEPDQTLATKIDRLFDVVRRPDGQRYTYDEVAQACREATGETFSATYLWQLRTGKRDNPTKRHLEALAGFFQVPPAYFFDDEQSARLSDELAALGAMRDAGVRAIALRAVTLSTDGQALIRDLVDAIARREEAGRESGRG